MKFKKIFRNKRAINGFPTTNGQVRSRAIHRTFQHYRIKKIIFISPIQSSVEYNSQ